MTTGTEAVRDHLGRVPVVERVLAVTTDDCGVITWCSPALEELLGYAAESLVGSPPPRWLFDDDEIRRRELAARVPFGPHLFLVHPRRLDRRQVRVDLGEHDRRRPGERQVSSASSGSRTSDWTLRACDGRDVVLSMTVQPVRDPRGRTIGYLALGVEVTEERRTQQLLASALEREQAASRRLEELHLLRNQFVWTASHELRTPLTSIKGYVDLLESHLDGTSASRELIERLRRNAARIHHLADQLLLLTDSTTARPTPAVCDLREVLEPARAALEMLPDHGEGVTFAADAADPVLVRADPQELQYVLVHLIDNGLKFSGPAAEVTCRVGVREGRAYLEVADNGPGIPECERSRVFEEFFRGASAVRDGAPGGGIGLSLVQRLVARHGGEVQVRDNSPQGAVVTVLLQLVEEA